MSTEERWRAETASAWLYKRVAHAESDARTSQLFRDLAIAAERQAGIVANSMDARQAEFRPDFRMRLTAAIVDLLSPRRCKPILAASKMRGPSVYDSAVVAGHVMPRDARDTGRRHRGAGGGRMRVGVDPARNVRAPNRAGAG